jgi:hypothetical protein
MDKYDIPDLLDRVKHLMPFHSETKVSVPHSYEMRLPKHLMEESHKVQNKFLNDSLGEIEEADNKNILPSQFKTWFSHQIHNYHGKSGIFNHDNWVNTIKSFAPPPHVLSCGFLINPFRHTPVTVYEDVNGDLLHTGEGSTSHGNFGGTSINCFRVPDDDWTWGHKYNQMALHSYDAETFKLAVYETDSDQPNDLLSAETEHTCTANTFTLFSRTEFALNNSAPWLTFFTNGNNNIFYQGGGDRSTLVATYADAFPDPITTTNNGYTDDAEMKLAHS